MGRGKSMLYDQREDAFTLVLGTSRGAEREEASLPSSDVEDDTDTASPLEQAIRSQRLEECSQCGQLDSHHSGYGGLCVYCHLLEQKKTMVRKKSGQRLDFSKIRSR